MNNEHLVRATLRLSESRRARDREWGLLQILGLIERYENPWLMTPIDPARLSAHGDFMTMLWREPGFGVYDSRGRE